MIRIALLLLLLAESPLGAATFEIRSEDPAGSGLQDPQPRQPVAGNVGATLGEQRRIAFEYAASIWGHWLISPVPIIIDASFRSLSCRPASASLGSAGPASSFVDFAGAPRSGTLYPSALADSLAGLDLDPGERDIVARFNADIDRGCFRNGAPEGWYYGLDGNPPEGQIDIVPVLLHELAHGLGFSTAVDVESGQRCCSADPAMQFDEPFMLSLEDHRLGRVWSQMSDAERRVSATRTGELHWIGPAVRGAASFLEQGRVGDHVQMHAPASLQQGSSVAHFATVLSPDELLEPLFSPKSQRQLTEALLADLGWRVALVVEPTPTATASPTPLPPADACDAVHTVADVIAVARVIAGATVACKALDSSGDGRIDATDLAVTVARLFGDQN